MICLHNIFLLLAIAAITFGQDNEAVLNNNFRPQARTVVHEVNLNRAFDASLPNIRHYITRHGMDPMDIPDVEIPLSHLPGLLRTKMHLHHGHIQELSSILRTGDIILQYSKKKVSLYLNIGWKTLDISYQYSLRYMLYSRRGDCYGRFHDIVARMLVDFDLESNKIDLKMFEFIDVGDFKLRLEGHLTDGLINILSATITKIFRTQVLQEIEARTYEEIDKMVQELNALLPSPNNIEVVTKETADIAPYRLDGLNTV